MPRDPRPYVTYPLNYTDHPRIAALSDAAFRVFHEMNDHSRNHGTDGVIAVVYAKKRWRPRALAELVAGIDDRPLVELTGDTYVLRSYSEHQMTTADVEALRSKRAEAGRAGGQAKGKQTGSKTEASALAKGKQNEAESKSESKSELRTTTTDGRSSYVPDTPAPDDDDSSFPVFPKLPGRNPLDLNRLAHAVYEHTDRIPTELQMQVMADRVTARTKGRVVSLTALLVASARDDWAEWQQLIDGDET